MLKKRIIPCLDIQNGRTVKGVNFVNIKDAGDPVVLGKKYADEGADELVFLDITATVENRKTLVELVKEIARHINIPFTVGGGISTLEDAALLIRSGADKVSINSSCVRNPQLVNDIAANFGSQCVVVAIDTKYHPEEKTWYVYVKGGREATRLETIGWAKEVYDRGAGEILLTSMNNDGTKQGFALDITESVAQAVSIPVIASGGAGTKEHFLELFNTTHASAALAAGIFHYNELSVGDLKRYLQQQAIAIRNVSL